MNKPCLLVFVRDWNIQSRIEAIARLKDLDYYFASRGEQLAQLSKTLAPFALVADLSGEDAEWIFKHVSELINAKPRFPVIIFYSDEREDVRERAKSYGCRYLFAESEFIRVLPETLDKILTGNSV